MSALPMPVAPPPGSTKLSGLVIGTTGSYKNQGTTIAKTFDGNASTFFDSPDGMMGWAGLDLGSINQITQVQFLPRSGFASRMVGGQIQTSPAPDFSAGVTTLYTISAVPVTNGFTVLPINTGIGAQYVRYLAPAAGSGNIAELEFDGTPIVATSVPTAPDALTASADSQHVHLSWTEDPASTVSSFSIQRQGPLDIDYVPIGVAQPTLINGRYSFDDFSVTASTTYSYVVLANNSLGSSLPSDPFSITTSAVIVSNWRDGDIGAVGKAGSAYANTKNNSTSGESFTITGGGADIWNMTDAFHFNYQTLTGNGSIVAQVTSETNTNGWAKSGIMIRESSSADARFILLALTPGNGVTMQSRTATHTTPSYSITTAGKVGVWLKLDRKGSLFSGYVSTDGSNWRLVGTVSISMVNNVAAGLCVTAHDNTKLCTATFNNVLVTTTGADASAWSVGAKAPMPRWESETFSHDGKLYVFGGFISRKLDATAECDVYDPATDTWSYLTTVPTGALTHASCAVVGDIVYLAGGDLGTFTYGKTATSTSAVLTYNFTTGQWGSVTALPVAQSCGGLVATNNHLYYFGGLNARNTADLTTTWALDLNNPSAGWVGMARMPNGRNHIGSAVINGIVYAVGGGHLYNEVKGNDAEVDAYDPIADQWYKVAALPKPWASNETTTLVVNNQIVLIGGQTNGGYDGIYLSDIEAYDPTTNAWRLVGNLPEANEGESVAYINGSLIVTSGTVDNLGGWSQDQTWINSQLQF